MSDYSLMPNDQFLNYIIERTNHISTIGDVVHFVLEQHT